MKLDISDQFRDRKRYSLEVDGKNYRVCVYRSSTKLHSKYELWTTENGIGAFVTWGNTKAEIIERANRKELIPLTKEHLKIQ